MAAVVPCGSRPTGHSTTHRSGRRMAGGASTRISPINAWGRPHFSRDPNRIYIYAGPEGLVSMRYDGTDRRTHIRVTGYTYPGPGAEPDPAGEIIISPDSDRVLALVGNY